MAFHTVYKTLDGHRVPATTTVLSVLNKPALVKWANELGKKGVDVKDYVDSLAKVGTLAHYMVESDCTGIKLETATYTPEQIAMAETSFLKWLYWKDSVHFQPIDNELAMVSERHQFGGTVDIIGTVNGIKTLIDVKTAKAVYPEHKTQVAGAYMILCEESGLDVKQVMIVRIGRSEEEGFQAEEVHPDEIALHKERFLLCRKLYEINKLVETY